ncbi:MAG: bis(5'-nucleosyl)-tetraphosphatase (symmetrical) YqeK [Anaerovoracaceae bacterium]
MNTDSINEYNLKNLSYKRQKHIEGVRDTAIKLADIYGEDKEKAEIAALFHDMFRGLDESVLNYYVKHLGLGIKYMNNCNLAHGKIAAIIMERDYGITDEDVLNAVKFHTTGRADMSILEKIVFMADAIEPNRVYPGVEEIREIAYKNLDKACLISICRTIAYVQSKGQYLDNDTILARDFFIKKEKINGK